MKNVTILLVDNTTSPTDFYKRFLENHGFEVLRVCNGEEAVRIVKSGQNIDLCLLDIELGSGNMDGSTAAGKILELRRVPIIFLTDKKDREAVEKAEKIPDCGYVLKDSGEWVLLHAIRKALSNNPAQREKQKDFIERTQSERQYETSESLLKNIIDAIQDGIVVVDSDLYVNYANRVIREWYRHSGQLIGEKCFRVFHNREKPCEICPARKTMHTEKLEQHTFQEPDFSGRYVQLFSCPLRERPTEPVTEVVEFVRDITDLKNNEKTIAEQRRFYHALLDNLRVGVVACNADGVLVYFNQTTADFHGLPQKELPPEEWADYYDLYRPDGSQLLSQEEVPLYRALRGESFHDVEMMISPENGEDINLSASGQPLLNEHGEIDGAVVAMYDITARKNAEERVQTLLDEKKMILQEVHHRIKNDMNTLKSMLSLQAASTDNEDVVRTLEEAQSRINLMKNIYNALYHGEDFQAIDIKNYLYDIIENLRAVYNYNENISIETSFQDFSISTKQAFPVGIIINELISNAFKYAFSEGGRGIVHAAVERQGADRLVITVKDNGKGVPPKVADGESLGFGLTLVDAFVSQYKGTLTIETNGGTTVRANLRILED